MNKYDVFEDGRLVGSIMLEPQAPEDRSWFWIITTRVPQTAADYGYAATREQAMEDFKRRWLI